MTTSHSTNIAEVQISLSWAMRLREASAPLFWTGLVLLLLSLPTALLIAVDPRLLHGVSVWLKPWKFQVSVGLYLLTLALFLIPLPEQQRRSIWVRGSVGIAVICGLLEVAYITFQGMLGQASHFNFSSPLYVSLYSLMGAGAVLLTTSGLVLAVVIERASDYKVEGCLKLGVVLGLCLTWVLGLGFGAYLSAQVTGHWVGGVTSDAGGLPLFGWSRTGGDLRVAHFLGIHAMHVIPTAAWILTKTPLSKHVQRKLTWTFAVLFSALTIATFTQARAGKPLIAERQVKRIGAMSSNTLDNRNLSKSACHKATKSALPA